MSHKSILTLIFFFCSTIELNACPVMSPGLLLDKNELIEKSDRILLIKILNEDKSEIIEVLKGKQLDNSKYKNFGKKLDYSGMYHSNHFENHTDLFFWELNIGRSEDFACGPVNTYIPGETYLIFPENHAARKSAEIIKNSNDKWYLYVKNKISNPNLDLYEFLGITHDLDKKYHIGTWYVDANKTYMSMTPSYKEVNIDLYNGLQTLTFTDDSYTFKQYDISNKLIDTVSYEYNYKYLNEFLIINNHIGNTLVFKLENKEQLVYKDQGTTTYFLKTHNKSLKHGTAQSAAP